MATYEVLSNLRHGEDFKKGTLVDGGFFRQDEIDTLVADGVLREYVEDTRVPLVPEASSKAPLVNETTGTQQLEQTTASPSLSQEPSTPATEPTVDPVVNQIQNDPQIQGEATAPQAPVTVAPVTLE